MPSSGAKDQVPKLAQGSGATGDGPAVPGDFAGAKPVSEADSADYFAPPHSFSAHMAAVEDGEGPVLTRQQFAYELLRLAKDADFVETAYRDYVFRMS